MPGSGLLAVAPRRATLGQPSHCRLRQPRPRREAPGGRLESGWGNKNVFLRNSSSVNGSGYGYGYGYGINIKTPSTGNIVYSSDTATRAAKGLTNVTTTR